MMKQAANFIAYQLVWFVVVASAGRDAPAIGIVAALTFVALQLAISTERASDISLVVIAVVLGFGIDGTLATTGLVRYAALPDLWPAPPWILALWAAFAMTWNHSLAWLRGRPIIAALLGAVGGPVAYLAAAHGFDAVALPASRATSLAVLAIGWGIALATLSWSSGRLQRRADPPRR
jgi:hypothetical protein